MAKGVTASARQRSIVTRRSSADILYQRALAEMNRREPNVRRAARYLEAAHTKGNYNATYALATWYLHGKEPILRQDLKIATDLLRLAAQNGIPDALYDLAVSYEEGKGVRKNPRTAFRYYVAAVIRGDKRAVMEVGRCLFWGIGTRKDRNLAEIYLESAKELGVFEPHA